MNKFKGVYINLKRSKERNANVREQLKRLDLTRFYYRFEAEKGDQEEAKEKGLTAGELGLWKSWMKILEKEISSNDDYAYLHIAEDDILMSTSIARAMQSLGQDLSDIDLIATDMYVNPLIFKVLSDSYFRALHENVCGLAKGNYTGCTSSIIISKTRLRKIYFLLEEEIKSGRKMIPIDNFLVRLSEQKKIVIARTVPFLTLVQHNSINTSTIQQRPCEETSLDTTREICYYLRKQLSIFREINDHYIVAKKILELANMEREAKYETTNHKLLSSLLECAINEKIFRYEYKENLKNEPLNDQ